VQFILMNYSGPAALLQAPADREVLKRCWPAYDLSYEDESTCVLSRR
jgi:hypothetical protein